MEADKTVSKRQYKSLKLQQITTTKPEQPKCKTQMIKNESIFLVSKQESQHFAVYQDRQIGFNAAQMAGIHLDADEDCQTTSSILKFGQELCFKDLQTSMRIPREQTETDSACSYEDY